jgi:hypothetical protein
MKNLYLSFGCLLIAFFTANRSVYAQTNGDYRTRASGNWNANNVWQKYNNGWSDVSTPPTSSNGVVTISHNITVNVNATASSIILSSNRIALNNGVTLGITGNLTVNGGEIRMSSGALSFISSSISIGGNLTLNNSGKIYSESAALSTSTLSIALKGNFSMNNTSTIYTDQGTLSSAVVNFDFNGTSTQVFSKSGGTITGTINFSVAGGAVVDFSSSVLSGSSGSFTLNDNGKIIVGNADPIQVTGTKTFSSTADYEFKGAITGSIGTTAKNVIVNNSGGNVTLSQPLTVTNNISFQNGVLITSAANLLTIADNATASGYSNSSFIAGPVKKKGNDNFYFPVGRIGAGLVPIEISGLSGSSDFTAEYKRLSPLTVLGSAISASGLHHVSNCEYWNLDRSGGSATANVTLYWGPFSNCNAAAYVTDVNTIVAAHFNGTSWNAFGRSGGTTGTISSGSVTWNSVSNFSPFALGSTSGLTNPLPVSLTNEKAYVYNNSIKVEWTNRTEKEIDNYIIERSANGSNFSPLTSIAPVKNNDDRADYAISDNNPLPGTSYYRVAARETNGKITFSSILRVETGMAARGFTIYPNPVTGNQFNLGLGNIKPGNYNLSIYNASGAELFRQVIISRGAGGTESVRLSPAVTPGIYTLLLTGNGYRQAEKIIVR